MALEYLASVMTIASESVDRLDQVPARLSVLFSYSAEAAMADDQAFLLLTEEHVEGRLSAPPRIPGSRVRRSALLPAGV